MTAQAPQMPPTPSTPSTPINPRTGKPISEKWRRDERRGLPAAGVPLPTLPLQPRISDGIRGAWVAWKKGYRVNEVGLGQVIGLQGRPIGLANSPRAKHRRFRVYIADVFRDRKRGALAHPGRLRADVSPQQLAALQRFGELAIDLRVKVVPRNGDPEDCRPSNLRLQPIEPDGARGRWGMGGAKKRKLDADGVRRLRRRHAAGEGVCALGRELGLAHATVGRIVRREMYAWVKDAPGAAGVSS